MISSSNHVVKKTDHMVKQGQNTCKEQMLGPTASAVDIQAVCIMPQLQYKATRTFIDFHPLEINFHNVTCYTLLTSEIYCTELSRSWHQSLGDFKNENVSNEKKTQKNSIKHSSSQSNPKIYVPFKFFFM